MTALDFPLIKARSLAELESVLAHFFPNGRRVGHEYELGNLAGEAGQSLKIHLDGGKRGVWSDFASGDSGSDPISLIAAAQRISQGEAAKKLATFLGLAGNEAGPASTKARPGRPKADTWQAILPIPDDAPPRPQAHPKHGKPDAWHLYRDGEGRVLGYVARFEAAPPKRPRKEFAWLVFACSCEKRDWRWQGFPEPRPLYGLEGLAQRPASPVLVVEGEKSVDAARLLLPEWVCLTWPGGGKAVDKADFHPLKGRPVVLWPDFDDPGRDAMKKAMRLARKAGASSVKLVEAALFGRLAPDVDGSGKPNVVERSRELPAGWDAADALAEGWTDGHLAVLLERRDFYGAPAAGPWNEGVPAGDSRFQVSDAGLYFVDQGRDGELKRSRVSDALYITAMARDVEGAGWAPVLAFQDMDGIRRQEIIPRRLFLGDGTDGPKQLADLGLFIEPGRQALDRLKIYVAGARPPKRARLVDSSGWHGDAYLLPEGAIGDSEETLIYRGSKRALGVFAGKGKLSDWQIRVARLAAGNPRLMFALSIACAGPLLRLCGGPSFAFHWVGDSSVGKSGCLAAAGSVWGNPAGTVHSWRTTDNALEYTAAQHNDGLLILDELKEVDAKQAGAIAYMLSNSKGKGRAHHAGGLREPLSWRIVMLSSGELGLSDHLASAGQKSHTGQTVRFIELSSDGGAGLGMWNELHGLEDGRAFTDALRIHAGKYHGTAGKAFVAALIERFAEVPVTVKKVEEAFFIRYVPADASGQVKRVAGCFALAAAAGELAAELGIVPWEPQSAFNAAGGLFREWLEGRPTTGNLEEAKILAHVRRVVEGGWQSRFMDWGRVEEANADLSRMPQTPESLGFRKKDVPFNSEDPSFLFYVTRERFGEEFCTKAGFNPRRVAALLKSLGILKCDADAATLKEKLPNGDPRSYCIIGRKLWEAVPC